MNNETKPISLTVYATQPHFLTLKTKSTKIVGTIYLAQLYIQ